MKIQTITSHYRNDFSAVVECEHCGATHEITSGYHDEHYYTQVIPGIHCRTCGMDRAGLRSEDAASDGA